MNQAVRTLPRFEPAAQPAPLSTLIGSSPRKIVEAIRYTPHEDDPRAILGENWIIRERDPVLNIIRESTDLYPSADMASWYYWMNEVVWEAWTHPVWSTSQDGAV